MTSATDIPDLSLLASAEALSLAEADSFARRLATWRPGTKASQVLAAGDNAGTASPDLMELLGVEDAAHFDPDLMWQWATTRRNRLRVPVGRYIDSGRTWFLDLKEDESANGPHVGLAGATGSGKSEWLRTLVLSLCMTHSPEELVITPGDFKGRITFAGLDQIPHVLAVFDNLDSNPDRVDRLRQIFMGELIHRQRVLDKYSDKVKNAEEYQVYRRRNPHLDLEPMPAWLIPFDELMQAHREAPGLITIMNIAGTVGRALDVHMIPVSQTFDPSMMANISPHLKSRIALKMNTPDDYRPILGSWSPPGLPDRKGVGYLVESLAEGGRPPVRVETCYVSKSYVPPAVAAAAEQERFERDYFKPVMLTGLRDSAAAVIESRYADEEHPSRPSADNAADVMSDDLLSEDGEDLDGDQDSAAGTATVMSTVIEVLKGHGTTPRQICLPELVTYIPTGDLVDRYLAENGVPSAEELVAPCGLVDKPRVHAQDILTVGLRNNAAVVGLPDSGKSVALASIIMSASLLYSPERVQFYCLDNGGGGLAELSKLDHVGDVVVGTGDSYGVQRVMNHIQHVLKTREASWSLNEIFSVDSWRRRRFGDEPGSCPDDGHGDVFLVVDGADSFCKEFDVHAETLLSLVERGPKYGVHVLLSANSWSAGRMYKFWDHVTHWYELKLSDSGDSKMGRDAADSVPGDLPGRGLISSSGTQKARKDQISAAYTNLKSIPEPAAFHLLFAEPAVVAGGLTEPLRGDAACGAVNGRWSHSQPARRIPVLPGAVGIADLAGPQPGALRLGLRESDLSTQFWDPAADAHLLVLGEKECGKSTALACVGRQLQHRIETSPAAQRPVVVVFDPRSSLLGVIPGAAHYVYAEAQAQAAIEAVNTLLGSRNADEVLTQEQLLKRRQEGHRFDGPEIFVVIDDAAFFAAGYDDPFSAWQKAAARGSDIGFHLVIAREADQAAFGAPRGMIAGVRSAGAPVLLMSADPSLRNLVYKHPGQKLPPGRGLYITRDEQMMIQVATG